jgi:hypothetical protein
MKQLLCVLVFMLAGPVMVLADECLLVDQTVRKGTVQKVDDVHVYLLENGEQVQIPRQDIESVVYESGKTQSFLDIVYLNDGRTLQGRVLRVSDSFCEINPAGAEVFERIELSRIIKIAYDNGSVMMPKTTAPAENNAAPSAGGDVLIGYDGAEIYRGRFLRKSDGIIVMQGACGTQRGVPVYMVKKMVRADGTEIDYEPEKKAHEKKAAESRDACSCICSADSMRLCVQQRSAHSRRSDAEIVQDHASALRINGNIHH